MIGVSEETGFTVDAIFGGAVTVTQSRTGYRFNIDSLILAARAAANPGARVIDVGSGAGVIALAMARLESSHTSVALEVQPSMMTHLLRNIELNDVGQRITPQLGDARCLPPALQGSCFDTAVMNPPYYGAREGQHPANRERAAARHQLHGTLHELFEACAALLCDDGRLHAMYPASRLPNLLKAAVSAGLGDVSVRPVVAFRDSPPWAVMVTCRRSSTLVRRTEEEFVAYDAKSRYSVEASEILSGRLPEARPH